MNTLAKSAVAAMIVGLILTVSGCWIAAEGGSMKNARKVRIGESVAFAGCAIAGAGLVVRMVFRRPTQS